MRTHLMSISGFRELARPTSKHLDESEVDKYIEEVEDTVIIPAIGLSTFKRLCESDIFEGENDYILLNGGDWSESSCGCGDGTTERRCYGIRKAMAYFVFARMVQNDGSILTRSGFIQHTDEHGTKDDDKNRVRKYNEVMQVAETYLSTCVEFLGVLRGECCKTNKIRGTRLRIHSIGD